MDRELLLEIGCEELPASWLPALTVQIGDVVIAQLNECRLPPEAPAETYSTPRRLAVRIARLAERQADLEEMITGPPVSASFKPDGTPTPAATGFAAKNGAEVRALERVETAKGAYLAFRRKVRGKTAVDVLPDVLRGTLRGLSFPKLMRWDAILDDGKGDLPFGRPIRWLLFTYGGRVVPFTIARTPAAQGGLVQDVSTAAVTYGHRFLTTSGRAGRAIKVRSFDEYRAKLLENFVILEREERHNKIARELDAKAQRLHGRVSRTVRAESALLQEVPDLVEYPSVVAGTFSPEFLELPEEVLTTTLIHHQHYFPVEAEDGKLKNAFLAVTNTAPENERTIARNAERVVTARLRDARFFWQTDVKTTLESRLDRLGTLLFHKKLGSYREKTDRIERLARTIASNYLHLSDELAAAAAHAARLSKVDLTTDMVREFTELQGKMGGIYGREEGLPEEVWKAIYYQYLPLGVEADAPPSKAQLGKAALTWVAVSLADKLDTVVGLSYSAGERPTGSRDPYGMRRAAHGVLKTLLDLRALTGLSTRLNLGDLLKAATDSFPSPDVGQIIHLRGFLLERLAYALGQRGFEARNVRAVTYLDRALDDIQPADELHKLQALQELAGSNELLLLGTAFKRVRNIGKGQAFTAFELEYWQFETSLEEPSELVLLRDLKNKESVIESLIERGDNFRAAFLEAAKFGPTLEKFFKDVFVMTENSQVRSARLRLLKRFENLVLRLADISEIVSDEGSA